MFCRARVAIFFFFFFARVHWILFNAPVFSSVDLSKFFYCSTWQYCVASLASTSPHLSPSRACAEPRKALAHHGGAGFVLLIVYMKVGCSRGHTAFLDFGIFSPRCPLLGSFLPRCDSSRSPAWTPAGGGLGHARVVSWRRVKSLKRRPYIHQ